jgi:hypothetical protein
MSLNTISVDALSEIIGYLTVDEIIFLHKTGDKHLWQFLYPSLNKAQYGMVCNEHLFEYLEKKFNNFDEATKYLFSGKPIKQVLLKIKYFTAKNLKHYECGLTSLLLKKIIKEQSKNKIFIKNLNLKITSTSNDFIFDVFYFTLPMHFLSDSTIANLNNIISLSFSGGRYSKPIILPQNLVDLAICGNQYALIDENYFESWPESIERLRLNNCLVHSKNLISIPNLKLLESTNSYFYDTKLPDNTFTQTQPIKIPNLSVYVFGHSSISVFLNEPTKNLKFRNPCVHYSYVKANIISNITNQCTSLKELWLEGPPCQYIIDEFSNPSYNFICLNHLILMFSCRVKINKNLVWILPNLTFLDIYRVIISDKNLEQLTKLETLYLLDTEPIQSDNLEFSGECLKCLPSLQMLAANLDIYQSEQLVQNILCSKIKSIWFYTGSFTSQTIHWLKCQFKKFSTKSLNLHSNERYFTISDRKYNRYKIMHKNKYKFDLLLAKTKQEFLQKYNIKLHNESVDRSNFY